MILLVVRKLPNSRETDALSGERTHSIPKNLAAALVALVMLLAALSLWTVIPLAWLWIGSQLTDTQFPTLGPYLVALTGVIASILVVAWILGLLNELYLRLTGVHHVAALRPGWLKSMGDTPKDTHPPTLLETVIVGSVLIAMITLLVWFFTLAGSPLPS